jgi:hypothetical protein
MSAMASKPAGIPLDDEPMDFDLGDLPTDEELDAAGTAAAAGGAVAAAGDVGEGESTPLGIFQLWFVMVTMLYLLTGISVGLFLAVRGAGQVGLAALSHPAFYLLVFFWPVTLWQLFWRQI